MRRDLPSEWDLYTICTLPQRKNPLVKALTPDQVEGTRPLTQDEVYEIPLDLDGSVLVARLCGEFGYTYEEARSLPPWLARWFIEFREETNL